MKHLSWFKIVLQTLILGRGSFNLYKDKPCVRQNALIQFYKSKQSVSS